MLCLNKKQHHKKDSEETLLFVCTEVLEERISGPYTRIYIIIKAMRSYPYLIMIVVQHSSEKNAIKRIMYILYPGETATSVSLKLLHIDIFLNFIVINGTSITMQFRSK